RWHWISCFHHHCAIAYSVTNHIIASDFVSHSAGTERNKTCSSSACSPIRIRPSYERARFNRANRFPQGKFLQMYDLLWRASFGSLGRHGCIEGWKQGSKGPTGRAGNGGRRLPWSDWSLTDALMLPDLSIRTCMKGGTYVNALWVREECLGIRSTLCRYMGAR